MMKQPSQKFFFLVVGLAALILSQWTGSSWAQSTPGEFTNLGIISVSRNYTIAENYSYIVFKIRNNSARTIHNIFGKVYRYNQAPNGKPFNFVLMNNPHKGGTIVDGKSHRPTEVVDWRFPFLRNIPLSEKVEKYTLHAPSQSIFFAQREPLGKTKLKPKQP